MSARVHPTAIVDPSAELDLDVVVEPFAVVGPKVVMSISITARGESENAVMEMDITKILDVLPHRYPMLLVDRIVESEPGKRIVGIKNVTINEPFFQGHFPGHPIMPGVLIVEAMAQAGGMLMMDAVK